MAPRNYGPRHKVPFLHIKQIEAEADLLIAEFGDRFHPVLAPPVPLDDMVELHLRLALEFWDMKLLFPFADVHGAIWFDQARIGVDQNLDPLVNSSRLGRYRFTLAHEVGHWRLHRAYFKTNSAEQRLFDDGTLQPDVVCRSSERKKPVESQADKFAASLLMPRQMVFAAWEEHHGVCGPIAIKDLRARYESTLAAEPFFHRGRILTEQNEKDDAIKEDFCRPIAKVFQVSAEAMRIRLETLNLFVSEKQPTLFT
jgi:Zn-dependent peptidase ImmA (M78 family)